MSKKFAAGGTAGGNGTVSNQHQVWKWSNNGGVGSNNKSYRNDIMWKHGDLSVRFVTLPMMCDAGGRCTVVDGDIGVHCQTCWSLIQCISLFNSPNENSVNTIPVAPCPPRKSILGPHHRHATY
jgi:hypothetical protein